MRTPYATALILALSLSASAQVVFDLPMAVPALGATDRQLWLDGDGIPTLPTSGQDLTWDLTSLELIPVPVRSFLADPATTPFTNDFPNATHAVGLDEGGFDTTWTYYELTDDSLFVVGGEWPPSLFTCPGPRLAAVFPFAYEQVANDSAFCQYPGFPGVGTKDGAEIVATGTINYPGGTISDVAMLRRWFNDTPLDEYYWYKTDDILFSVGRYWPEGDQISLHPAVEENAIAEGTGANSALAYPTPASDELFVDLTGNGAYVHHDLLDATGRLVRTGDLAVLGGRVRMDVSLLPAGHYALRLIQDGISSVARVSIAR